MRYDCIIDLNNRSVTMPKNIAHAIESTINEAKFIVLGKISSQADKKKIAKIRREWENRINYFQFLQETQKETERSFVFIERNHHVGHATLHRSFCPGGVYGEY